jgi:hypothetical protein
MAWAHAQSEATGRELSDHLQPLHHNQRRVSAIAASVARLCLGLVTDGADTANTRWRKATGSRGLHLSKVLKALARKCVSLRLMR